MLSKEKNFEMPIIDPTFDAMDQSITRRKQFTPRQWKGYWLEYELQWMLTQYNYEFIGTPVDPKKWLSENEKFKVDVTLSNGVRLECKHIDGIIYPSWYKRDWKNKGSCVFVYKGDLKLSRSIKEQPILIHYSLLKVYLEYNIKLYRSLKYNVVNRNKVLEPISSNSSVGISNYCSVGSLSCVSSVEIVSCNGSSHCGDAEEYWCNSPLKESLHKSLHRSNCKEVSMMSRKQYPYAIPENSVSLRIGYALKLFLLTDSLEPYFYDQFKGEWLNYNEFKESLPSRLEQLKEYKKLNENSKTYRRYQKIIQRLLNYSKEDYQLLYLRRMSNNPHSRLFRELSTAILRQLEGEKND